MTDSKNNSDFGTKINNRRIGESIQVDDLVDNFFNAYNSARLSEAARLLNEKLLNRAEVYLGMTLSGALTPAGLGASSIATWIENGWIDYIVSTGANLYHDFHYALDLDLLKGAPDLNDHALKKENLIRIYDIVFHQDVLFKSDETLEKIMSGDEFQKKMSSVEAHHLLGKYYDEIERATGTEGKSVLAAAYRAGVPVFCPSPGDSTIGLVVAKLRLIGHGIELDPIEDVLLSSAIVYEATRLGKSAAIILGGGAPKNFLLQTVPMLDEILKMNTQGHDYFIQITDARSDTGGLSGATPSEAMTWGKLKPDQIPDTVVAYLDLSIAIPIMTSYLINKSKPRAQKRLHDRLDEMSAKLKKTFQAKSGLPKP